MKVTKNQLRFLKIYQELHRQPPTVFGLLWLGRLGFLALVPGVAVGIWFILMLPPSAAIAGYFVIGMCVGAYLRDIGRSIASVRLWPAIEHIVSWQRVDETVRENEKTAG
jgi:hypothetical protein